MKPLVISGLPAETRIKAYKTPGKRVSKAVKQDRLNKLVIEYLQDNEHGYYVFDNGNYSKKPYNKDATSARLWLLEYVVKIEDVVHIHGIDYEDFWNKVKKVLLLK